MEYDIIIVGGGMVGASLACALQETKLRIALIDATKHPMLDDPRLIALTHGSCCLLQNLGVWPPLAPHAAAIKQLHVSKQNHFGITRVSADELNLKTLGHLIPAKYINASLEEKLNAVSTVEIFRPAVLKAISTEEEFTTLTLQTDTETKKLRSRIVIGADGTQSTVRELLKIPTKNFDYHQSAIVTTTLLQRNHHHIAYERFLQNAAIAMLPQSEKSCATIWTDSNEKITHLMQMNDEEFVSTLQKEFGYRLGRFQKVLKRHTYPLKYVVAEEYKKNNILLVGNAAHTLHPIASQGLNLALYEIAELVDYLKNETATPSLKNYSPTHLQQKISTQLSHHLGWFFSTDFFIIHFLRQIGMLGLDACKQAKTFFMHKAMGKTGKIPRLLREREYHYNESNSI
jgi:2-octaprenyl-6-methoxyphenol hydroxylase